MSAQRDREYSSWMDNQPDEDPAPRKVWDAAWEAATKATDRPELPYPGVTIPEHLSRRDELGPAIRKLVVGEARAENERRRGAEQRQLREAASIFESRSRIFGVHDG